MFTVAVRLLSAILGEDVNAFYSNEICQSNFCLKDLSLMGAGNFAYNQDPFGSTYFDGTLQYFLIHTVC